MQFQFPVKVSRTDNHYRFLLFVHFWSRVHKYLFRNNKLGVLISYVGSRKKKKKFIRIEGRGGGGGGTGGEREGREEEEDER